MNVRNILHEYGAEELFNSILNDAGKQLRKLINVALKRLTAGQNKSKGDDEEFEFDELDRRLQELTDQVEKQPEQYEAEKHRDFETVPSASPRTEGRTESSEDHLAEERKQQEEEAKKAEEARLKKEEEEKQRAEEERIKKVQEAKRIEEEKKKADEEKERKELEEKQRLEQEKQKLEQARKEEEKRLKQEDESKKREEARVKQEQEAKRIEDEKKKQEEEKKRIEEESKRKREVEDKQKQVQQAAPAAKSPTGARAKESTQNTERKALLSAWKEITGGNKQPAPGLKASGSAPNVSTQASASKAAASSEAKVKHLVTRIEKFVPESNTSTHSAPTDPAKVRERASTSSLARNEKYRNILSFWHVKDAEASANTTQSQK